MHYGEVRIGVGLSTAPDARRAADEAASTAAEALGGSEPSLAVLLTSPHHADDADAVLAAVHEVAAPEALVGCVAGALVAGRREVEDGPSVVVWLASLQQPVETFHMQFVSTGSGGLFAGHRFDPGAEDFHLLLPDPYTFPADLLLDHLNANLPGTTVMGGLVSGAGGPGRSRLFHDEQVLGSGAVGVRLPGWRGVPVVSQGCRPIGAPYTVTGARGRLITELGGHPPLERLQQIADAMPPAERQLLAHGLQMGIVVDEYQDTLGTGDFLVRGILDADESTGAIEIGEQVEVGTTVQFQVRDAAAADDDLRATLTRAREDLSGRPAGALLFTCNGRGSRMFKVADHDAKLVTELLDGVPLAGFFAAGELGPVGSRNALHGFTASLALFVE